jgi:hypothetical protein
MLLQVWRQVGQLDVGGLHHAFVVNINDVDFIRRCRLQCHPIISLAGKRRDFVRHHKRFWLLCRRFDCAIR